MIDKEKITVLHSVPSLFRRFAESLSPGEQIESVRAIKLGGEPMFSSDVDLFRQHFRSETILINGLGLTEANGNVCHFRVTHDTAIASATVPVGQALPGIEIKLFGDNDEEVPASKVGEISLRGKYLSPGIWNGSKIDKRQHGEWLRTGDLGRSDAQGNYEHLGRKDDRLKLRGHWVCPAEIESALMEIPMVREAAVVPIKSRQRETTIAAFTTSRNSAPSEEELRARLREKLPSHLLPNRFFSLADMPLLPSGKVNRQQLVQRAAANSEVSSRYDSTDTIELQLVRIWESVLRIECVTADDDFFAVGGDSLAAAALFAAVEKFFNVDLPVSTLLQAPTIKLLAKAIRMRGPSVVDLRLVALQLGGSNPPLYCVPGADSAAISLRHLARRLGPEQPFFAFQPRGLDGRPPYLRTVEQMAADYLDVLRQHQPRGPYCLCGTSFGGVVAFEMACSLIAQGERVSFLGLLDTYGGDYPRPRRDLSLRKKIKVAMRRSRAGATKTFSEWWQRLLVRLDLKFGFRPLPRPHAQRYLYLQEICFAARRHYSLRPFNGRIHLFRLEAQPSATLYELDPFLGWRGAATGGIEVHEVPGRHGFHLREPNVGDLAKKLARCLSHAKGARLEFEPCIKC